MKAKIIIPLLLAALILVSCKKDETEKNTHRIIQILTDNVENSDVKVDFTYDGSKLVLVMYSYKNESGTWIEYSKAEMTYNAVNTVNTYYAKESGSWYVTGKSEYIVENGLITEEINYDYEDFGFVVDWKWNYQYTDKDLLAWQSYEVNQNGFFVQDGKGDYLYNNNKLTEYLSFDVDDFGNWASDDRETFTYTNGKLTSWIDFYYNESGQWVRSDKCEHTFSGDRISGAFYYEWNSNSGIWESSVYYSETYTYNSNGYLTQRQENDGTRITYQYEEGHGNAKYFWYYPESLVYGRPTLKGATKKGEYLPYYKRHRR